MVFQASLFLPMDEKTRIRLIALVIFLFFTLLYAITSHASVVSSDEVSVFGTSINIATRHILNIDNLRQIHRITPLGQFGVDRHLYTKYFPGNIISAAVIYRLTAKSDDESYIWTNPKYGSFQLAPSQQGARNALRLNALLGALGMMVLFLFLSRQHHWRTAAVTTLLMGLTTDWWNQSRTFYSEIGAGTFLIISLYFADQKRPYLSSLSFAISLLFRPTNLLALPVWAYAVWKTNPKAVFSGIFWLGSLGLFAIYNYVRFGSFLTFGYGAEGFGAPVFEGLRGVLLSPGHSMFLHSPVVLLAAIGSVFLYKQNKPMSLLLLYCVIGYILMAATWYDWRGGKVWGCRLVVPILPLAGILVAPVIDKLLFTTKRIWLPAVLLPGLLGLSIQLIAIVQSPMIALNQFVDGGYATHTESIWSLGKSWPMLQIKSLATWNTCNIDAYSIRSLISTCE
jgi:hypothetical protein